MQTSVFLAKLIGPLALALGIALAGNGAAFRAMAGEFLNSPALIFLAGIITLPAGLAIVLTHNVWTPNWRVVITIVGWLSIIAGTFRTVAPQYAAAMGRSKVSNPVFTNIGAAIWLAVGALLCFFGYFH
jgi:hypothetical protein